MSETFDCESDQPWEDRGEDPQTMLAELLESGGCADDPEAAMATVLGRLAVRKARNDKRFSLLQQYILTCSLVSGTVSDYFSEREGRAYHALIQHSIAIAQLVTEGGE